MKSIVHIPLILAALAATTAAPWAAPRSLEEDFNEPPVHTRPYVWWHWLGPNFSKSGITKDLEAMRDSGIGGATIFNITSSVNESHAPTGNNPWPDQTYRSPKYWEALRHAAAEAKRLGLEVGLHNTVGYSTTGGPWIDEPRSMQRVVWSTATVEGGRAVAIDLPPPNFSKADEGWGKSGRVLSWFRDFAVLAVPADRKEIALTNVVDLTAKCPKPGQLRWEAPAGQWVVYRLAHASTGRPPHPVPDDVIGKTLEADKMSAEQTRFHWDSVLLPIKEHLGPLLGDSFRHFLIDSYEAGNQNWTPAFREEFRKRKGYDPLPWLMTMNGTVRNGRGSAERTLENADATARFEWDYRDVIQTLYFDNGWAPAARMIRACGATLQHEAYGGPFDTIAGSALADLPMVEFWTKGDANPSPAVIGAARAAGRRVVGAEAFTGSPTLSRWDETPAFLRPFADSAFAGGVNRLILHHWVHQPFDDRYKPAFGMGWWGTHFNRHQTWFEPGKEFFRYLGRVQALMQRGESPADHVSVGAAVANGDAIPLATFLADVRVENGQIVLPSGRRYRFIHVPHPGALLPETAARIEQLLAQGATVVSPKPNRSPSLAGYPGCDDQVRAIAGRVWGDSPDARRAVGKGTLFGKGDVNAARAELGIVEPVRVAQPPGRRVRICTRSEDGATWHFVANLEDQPIRLTIASRVTGKLPELWDAETGTIRPAPIWRTAGAETEVDLALEARKSVIVMFRKPLSSGTNPIASVEAAGNARVVTDADGSTRIEASESVSGTIRFASGGTRPFKLEPSAPVDVAGPWKVDLKPAVGAPRSLTLDALRSLTEQPDADERYFSGIATYRTSVQVPAALLQSGQRVQLDLGTVRDLATVTLNGRTLGSWWHPPFSRDVTAMLKPGPNTLEIAVANTWHNRLVGDEQEPADFEWGTDRGGTGRTIKAYPDWFVKNTPRPSSGRKAFVVWYYHRKDTPLLPSGLIGPVRLVPAATVTATP